MKKSIFTLAFLLFFWTLVSAQSTEVAPKIISTIPEFGDCNVDPELKEVILKFDQDMSGGMSVVDTKNTPVSKARAYWIDKRTCAIPVKLFPDKLYSLAFNSSRFTNFRNLNGIPLNPDELYFKTKNISFAALNKQSYNEFVDLFPKMYSYASIKGIDWKEVLTKNQSELENSKSPAEFALKLVKILKPAEDPHMLIDVEGERFSTGRMKIVNTNYTAGQLFTILQERKASSTLTTISGVYDNIGYISLKDWNTDPGTLRLKVWGNSQNPEYPLFDVLKELTAYPNLIIDVRENSGGSELFARKIASIFINDSIPYEKVLNYNEITGKFDKVHIKKIYPSPNHIEYTGKIYVLSGPTVLSSNESFILMMKQLPNATVVGMKTYGSTGNPQPYTLANGVTIYLPSWQAYTLDGKLIEGNGIEPDIEIITNKEDFQKKDILFEKVVSLIKEQK
jgi:hypothetical protein